MGWFVSIRLSRVCGGTSSRAAGEFTVEQTEEREDRFTVFVVALLLFVITFGPSSLHAMGDLTMQTLGRALLRG